MSAPRPPVVDVVKPYLPRLLTTWPPGERFRRMEGSLAFVDVSGFTAMSERLARRGKVGAEEVTDVIGSCFTALLGVAYGQGGGLVKFGGDALLLFFSGQDHAARAARSAAQMRRALRDMGRIVTSAGPVTLRMSAGVHSGGFDFALVGESHLELLVTGPAATQAVLMEQAADAGEVVVSEATARHLPAAALGEPKGVGRLLRRTPAGASARPASDREAPPGPDLARYLPPGIREHVVAGATDAEHRMVTVAFLAFEGIDALIERSGIEAAWAALDGLVREVQAAAERHAVTFLGSDIAKDGGKLILVAGAPAAGDDDEERMLRTLRRIAGAEIPVPLRMGINRGHVFAGAIGPPYRRTYTVMGDAVNLAARLMAAAEPGAILATDGVLERSQALFEAAPLPPLKVKGKSRPVRAFRVGAIVGSRTALTTRAPLVGREQEMAVLLEGLASARSGAGRVIEIVGEPGIGKSRLLEEVRAHRDGARWLAVQSEQYEATTPYFAFQGLLRRLAGIQQHDDDAVAAAALRATVEAKAPALLRWLPLLAVPAGLELPRTPEIEQLEERFRKARLEEATVELLAALLPEPAVLVFEDTHWMDEASSALLHRLVATVATRPWLVIATRREADTGFRGVAESVTVLRPAPLSAEAARLLLGSATEEAPLRPHELEGIAARAGGNPLFLQELLAASRAGGAVQGLPDSVEATIAARIDRLSPPDRAFLRRASVLGAAFPEELGRAVLGEDLPDPAAGTWRRLAEFLERADGGSIRFRHALIRDAAYEGLPFRLRRELHGRVGRTLERGAGEQIEEHAAVISLHFFHAHRFEPAWRYARLAAERAHAIFANVEAGELYERALEAARHAAVPPAELASVAEALGDVRYRIGEFGRATRAYRSARRLIGGDRAAEARLLLKEAWIARRAGRYPEALRWITRARRLLERAPADAAGQLAQLSVWYGSVRQEQGRSREAMRWLERAVAEAEATGDREALAHAYYLLDWVRASVGLQPTFSERALAIYEELGDLPGQANVLNNLGGFAYWAGRWTDAVELYERARRLRERTGDAVNAAFGTANIGELLSDQGRLDEAERMLRDALRVWRAAGDRPGTAYALGQLGRVAARAGRHDEALALFDQARGIARDVGDDLEVLQADARIAETALLQGEAASAYSLASLAAERAREIPGSASIGPMLERVRGYALAQMGRWDEATSALDESLRAGLELGAEYEVALTRRAIAEVAAARGSSAPATTDADAVLRKLGVVTVPKIPLVRAARAQQRARAPITRGVQGG